MTQFLKPHYLASTTLIIWGSANTLYSYKEADSQNLNCHFDQREPFEVLIEGITTLGELLLQCFFNPLKALTHPQSIRVPLEKIEVQIFNGKQTIVIDNKCKQLTKQLNMGIVCVLSSISLALLGFFYS